MPKAKDHPPSPTPLHPDEAVAKGPGETFFGKKGFPRILFCDSLGWGKERAFDFVVTLMACRCCSIMIVGEIDALINESEDEMYVE